MDTETIERPSHFIAASSCDFGRTTMIPGYIVSSVGEYRSPLDPSRFETIGCDRLYETFVFRWSGERCVDPECRCGGIPTPDSWSEIDSLPANTRTDAIMNHEKLVRKWVGVAKRKEPTDDRE